MRLTLALAADYANTTAEGKLNILGVFTEVNLAHLPGALQQMFLVLSYEVDRGEFGQVVPIRVTLQDDQDGEVISLEGAIAIPREQPHEEIATLNQIVGLGGIEFRRPGRHEFIVSAAERRLGSVTIQVNVMEGGQDGD